MHGTYNFPACWDFDSANVETFFFAFTIVTTDLLRKRFTYLKKNANNYNEVSRKDHKR